MGVVRVFRVAWRDSIVCFWSDVRSRVWFSFVICLGIDAFGGVVVVDVVRVVQKKDVMIVRVSLVIFFIFLG